MPGACEDQKRALAPLEPELGMLVNHHVVLGTELGSSARITHALKLRAISPAPIFCCLDIGSCVSQESLELESSLKFTTILTLAPSQVCNNLHPIHPFWFLFVCIFCFGFWFFKIGCLSVAWEPVLALTL